MNIYTSLSLILIGVGCSVSSPHRSVVDDPCSVDGVFSCSSDCKDIHLCNGNHQTFIKKCPLLKYCDAINGDCSATTRCTQPPPTIACNSFGLFPDPFDCTKYHICIKDDGTPSTSRTCSSPTAYDPLSTNCVKTLQDRVCLEKPIPSCLKDFQKGAQEENPNIYYICIDGIPNLYRCDPGLIYINATGGCGLPTTTTPVAPTTTTASPATTTTTPTTTTTSGTSTTTSGTTITTSTTTTRPTTTPVPTTTLFPCPGEGTYLDPTDPSCRTYIICIIDLGSLIPVRRSCSVGYHYDLALSKCVAGVGQC